MWRLLLAVVLSCVHVAGAVEAPRFQLLLVGDSTSRKWLEQSLLRACEDSTDATEQLFGEVGAGWAAAHRCAAGPFESVTFLGLWGVGPPPYHARWPHHFAEELLPPGAALTTGADGDRQVDAGALRGGAPSSAAYLARGLVKFQELTRGGERRAALVLTSNFWDAFKFMEQGPQQQGNITWWEAEFTRGYKQTLRLLQGKLKTSHQVFTTCNIPWRPKSPAASSESWAYWADRIPLSMLFSEAARYAARELGVPALNSAEIMLQTDLNGYADELHQKPAVSKEMTRQLLDLVHRQSPWRHLGRVHDGRHDRPAC